MKAPLKRLEEPVPFDGGDFSPRSQRAAGPPTPASTVGWCASARTFCNRALRACRVQSLFVDDTPEPVERATVHLLREARRLIDTDEKWVQGYYSTADERRCAIGALRSAGRHPCPRRVRARAHHLLREVAHERGFQSVEGMNDRCSHQQVLAAFDASIRVAEHSSRCR